MALDLVSRSYARPDLDLAAASRELGVTKAHLCRVFRHQVGVGFPQHLRRVRAERAEVLLRESADSVKQIAAAVGFDHTAQLDHAFKERFDCTPTQLRNRWATVAARWPAAPAPAGNGQGVPATRRICNRDQQTATRVNGSILTGAGGWPKL